MIIVFFFRCWGTRNRKLWVVGYKLDELELLSQFTDQAVQTVDMTPRCKKQRVTPKALLFGSQTTAFGNSRSFSLAKGTSITYL